jgi:hypothetical protein
LFLRIIIIIIIIIIITIITLNDIIIWYHSYYSSLGFLPEYIVQDMG